MFTVILHVAGITRQEGYVGSRVGSAKSFGAGSLEVPNLAPPIISLVTSGAEAALAATFERGCNTANLAGRGLYST